MYIDKLNEMLKLVEENHLDMYFNITKKDLKNFIKEILEKHKIKDDYDFYYVFNLIIKKIFGCFDSHTKLVWEKNTSSLPLRFRYLNNKLYIIRTDEENKDILFGQVLEINNIEIKQLIQEIKKVVVYSTDEYLTSCIENIFYNDKILKTLPSIDNNIDIFNFKILLNNNIINKKIKTKEKYSLGPSKPKQNYYFEVIDDIIYIVYNSSHENYHNQMLELIDKISVLSKNNNINKFIIDLRGNGGGDSRIIKPLIKFLKGKKVVTLVDGKVFSSGSLAIVDLSNIGSKFVGTKIGTAFNVFGHINVHHFDNFVLIISVKYIYFDKKDGVHIITTKEEFKKFKDNKYNHKYLKPNIFEPDYFIENKMEDYIDNFDRQKQEAINIINEKSYK